MQSLASFSQHDVERLFLTYKRNPINYTKIKQEVVGDDVHDQYHRVRRSSTVFFGAITFIIVVSSAFSLVAAHYDSLVALWMIWGGTLVLYLGWIKFYHSNTYAIHTQNEDFFSRFELVAQSCDSLDEFVQYWTPTTSEGA